MKRNIIEITEHGTITIPSEIVWMSEEELVSLFGVIAPTVRAAIKAVYMHFVEGYKGTVIKHAEGYLGRLEYLIEFDDHIGSKTSECGKDGHCFWMNESRDNDKLEVRLPMWDHPLLLECKSVKADQ